MRLANVLAVIAAALGLGFALGCGEQGDERAVAGANEAADDARDAAETLGENVERSERIMEETYDDERKAGTDAISAAGDAYDAVLDEPLEREKEDEEKR